jgi:hypothetical protein
MYDNDNDNTNDNDNAYDNAHPYINPNPTAYGYSNMIYLLCLYPSSMPIAYRIMKHEENYA